ncbi:ankyrin, partial [Neocallimastix californiae]
TVLREIIHDNKTSILNYLIDHGLPIEKRNSEGNTLLFLAIFYRKLDIIKLLLDKGANIKHKNKKGERKYPLFLAIFYRKLEFIKLLLVKGANIKHINKKGESIIHDNKIVILKTLMKHGLLLEMKNSEGNTPLFLSIFYRNTKIIEMLLENGANIKHKNKNGEVTVKMVNQIIEDKKLNILKFLIDHKLNLEMENKDGWTPLFYAVSFPRPVMVEALLKYGANIN